MVNALEAGTIVAVMAGVVGWFMVLRRQSFAGHTLSVMAFPGATGALLLGLPAAAGYFVFCGLAALVIGGSRAGSAARSRAQESAITGTVQAFGLACGFLFLSLYRGVLGELREPAVRQLPRHHRAGRCWRSRSCAALALALLRRRRAAAAVRLGRRARVAQRRRRADARARRRLPAAARDWRSRRPRRSPARCWCSRCWSRRRRPPS